MIIFKNNDIKVCFCDHKFLIDNRHDLFSKVLNKSVIYKNYLIKHLSEQILLSDFLS